MVDTTINPAVGNYLFSKEEVDFNAFVPFSTGSYSLSGKTSTFKIAPLLSSLRGGTYTLTKEPQAKQILRKTATGSYSQVGKPQVFAKGRKVPLTVGTYSLAGKSQNLSHTLSENVFPTHGTFTYSGNVQNLVFDNATSFSVPTGFYGLTGESQILGSGDISDIAINHGSFVFLGKPVTLIYHNANPISITKGLYSAVGFQQGLLFTGSNSGSILFPSSGGYTQTTYGAGLDKVKSTGFIGKLLDCWTLWSSQNPGGRRHRIKSGVTLKR